MSNTTGIISNTIVINLGDSLSNINEVKKGLKDVRAALKTMEQDQGKSAMVNGTLMDAKELQKVIQRLHNDMKVLQGTSSTKSTATKGIDDAVVETKKQLQTLQAKVRETMTAADKAWQTGSGFSGARRNFEESLNQLVSFKKELGTLSIGQEKGIYTGLRRRLNEDSASAKVLTERIKELNAETARNKARDSVVTPKVESIASSQYTNGIKEAKQAILAIDRQIFEQLQKNNGLETQRTQELRRQKAELEAQVAAVKTKPTQDYQSYQRAIANARMEAEKLHQVMTKTNTEQSRVDFANAKKGLKEAQVQAEAFNRSIGQSSDRVGMLGSFMQKFRSHFNWLVAGAALGAIGAIPVTIFQTLKDVEQGMAGIQQVVPELHKSRVALNEESIAIIAIASQFGLGVNDIIESYKLWARAYKDTDVVKTLVNSAAILAKADNFSMTEANKAIEGIMLQYGVRIKTAEEANKASMKIVDSMTNVSHNAMVSAQDLAAANIRSASAAKQAGVSFDFLQGMIATMSRNTGRAGGEIGNAIRSMMVSIHSDKAVAEIEKMGIAMYKVGADGTKAFRDVEEVIVDLMLTSDATDKNIEKMMLAASGGEPQLAV